VPGPVNPPDRKDPMQQEQERCGQRQA
jgi:hypothetical protein